MKDLRRGCEGPSDLTEPRDATDDGRDQVVPNRSLNRCPRLIRILSDIDENELVLILRAADVGLRHLHGFEERVSEDGVRSTRRHDDTDLDDAVGRRDPAITIRD